MRFITALLVFFFISSPVWAGGHGAYSSGVTCPYSVDNGCITSTSFVATPYWSDPTFAYNTADSGQLPTDCVSSSNCTVNTNAIANLTALWHSNNVNYPYWDYPIGSANPATLTAASTINDATCKYAANGTYPSGFDTVSGPLVTCVQTASSPAVETLQGYDFTNIGTGTGSGCVLLLIKSAGVTNSVGGNTDFIFRNNYHKTLNQCFEFTTLGVAPLIYIGQGGNDNATIEVDNITCDGNFDNRTDVTDPITGYISGTTLTVTSGTLFDAVHPGAESGETLSDNGVIMNTRITGGTSPNYTVNVSQIVGSAGSPVSMTGHRADIIGNLACIIDTRAGTNGQHNLTVRYSLFKNLGHDSVYGTTGGDENFYYNAFINNCVSGNCHGEMWEHVAGFTFRNANVVGNIQVAGGAGAQIDNRYVGWTSHLYFTSGLNNNVRYGTINVQNNLLISNLTNCSNHAPYNPSNPCVGPGTATYSGGQPTQTSVSTAFMQINPVFVNGFNVTGNIVAAQADYSCMTKDVASSGNQTGAVMGVLSPGINFTITTRPTNYQPVQALNYFPGMVLVDLNATDVANGWVNAPIITNASSITPNFQSTGTPLCVTGQGAPGGAGGVGCGTFVLGASEPVTVGAATDFDFVTDIRSISWSNNFLTGGSYGVSARSYPSPGTGRWGVGLNYALVACPS